MDRCLAAASLAEKLHGALDRRRRGGCRGPVDERVRRSLTAAAGGGVMPASAAARDQAAGANTEDGPDLPQWFTAAKECAKRHRRRPGECSPGRGLSAHPL